MVRNEELHLNYGITVDKLAKWLKISFNPSLNESTLGGRPWLGNSSTGKPVRGASLEVVNRWRSEILPNENVWSIAIDKQDFIWVLTSGGIQGYSAVNYSQTLNPIYLIDFYNYLPLFRGDHIRVDSQDNKWITTRHSGVKVILENTQYWPDAEGFTQENSGLLSNNVNDIAFDEENGFVWFSTDLGVSRFSYPTNTKHVEK